MNREQLERTISYNNHAITMSNIAISLLMGGNPQNKELRGYHVDKMCNPNLSATALMKSRSEYKKDADFYNFDLGLPYSERSTALTREILEECYTVCGVPYRMSRFAKQEEQVTMGIDQGDTLWIEVSATDMVTGKRKIIYAESVNQSQFEDGDPFQRIPDRNGNMFL